MVLKLGHFGKVEWKYLRSFVMWKTMDRVSRTDQVRNEVLPSVNEERNRTSKINKNKQGLLDWAHLAYEVP